MIETNDLVLVTDPNWLPKEIEAIKTFVDKVKKDRPVYLLFTHSDYDHILGYRAFPEAKVIASKTFIENSYKDYILKQIRDFDDKYYLERNYEIAYPEADVIVEKDGQVLTIGETELTFYLAPGHTPDGIFSIIESEGIWIAGDYLSDIEFPFIYDSSFAYEDTMLKAAAILNDHPIKLLVPGHGDVTESREEIRIRLNDSLNYIRELRTAMKNEDQETIDSLFKSRPYRDGMKPAHDDNQKLMERERHNEQP